MKPLLTADEEASLADRIRHGPDPIGARNELVMRNERLANTLARKLVASTHREFEDLVQDAMIGLMQAAERFDPSRNVRFAAYARWFIRRNIFRTLNRATVVRIPRGEWGKSPRREESSSEYEESFTDDGLSPLDAMIRAEEAADAASLRSDLDELTDSEWLLISGEFGLDGKAPRRSSSRHADRHRESAYAKLREAYLKRKAG